MLCIVLANLALVNCAPLFGFNWINQDVLTPASFDDEVSDFQVEIEERNQTKKSGDLKLMANNSSDSNETLELSSFTSMTSTISPVNVSTTSTTTMSTTSSSTTYTPSSNSTETSTRTTLQPSGTTLASTSTSTMDPKKMTDLMEDDPILEPIPNAFNFSADGLTTSHPATTQMPSTSMRPSMTMFSTTPTPSTRYQTGPAVTTTTSPNKTTPNVVININSAGKASSGSSAFRVSALAGILIVFAACRLF